MQTIRVGLWLMLSSMSLFACSSDDPPPSCQQAIAHFYTAGCVYRDTSETPPVTISQAQMITLCQTATADAPESCKDEVEAWLVCNNEVPTPSTTIEQCDCMAEVDALQDCE